MRLRRPRAASVFTGLVMICLYAPIVTVVVFSVNKDPNLISWKRIHHPVVRRRRSTTHRCAGTS